jgi:oligosaccharide 4-alpha-D-glucosyltransferase
VYGGGSRALPLNRRGYAFMLDNNPWYGYSNGADNLNFSVPFFTSSAGYGLFFDNPSKGKVDIGKTNPEQMTVTFSSGEINVFIIFGANDKDILKQYHGLTGKQGLPPRWAMGNFMSRFGYSSEQQVNEIASKMQTEKIPFDAVIFDLFWFGDSIKGTMGNLQWVNKNKWPNPGLMISNFKKQKKQKMERYVF